MAIEIQDIMKTEDKINTLILELNEDVGKSESLKKKARFYALLKKISDLTDTLMEGQKPLLLEQADPFYFTDEGIKVYRQEGKKQTYIDAPRLFDNFMGDAREDDLKKIISISETSIKKLEDSETVIKTYKVTTNETVKPSLKVSPLNKEEKIKLEEGVLK